MGGPHLTVAGLGIDVVRKDIKNLHISVYPPHGRVRVAAPDWFDEDAIRLAVIKRLPWIKQQRNRLQNAARQTERTMRSGETHYVWGKALMLDVSRSGRPTVKLDGDTLWVVSPPSYDSDARRRQLDNWYRRETKIALPALLAKWEPVIGVESSRTVIRRMKTKWGTCVPHSRAIWINPELAKKNPRCLEYIVVHELVHLHERTHSGRFIALMDLHMPDWRARRDELNEAPLADEEWGS